MCERTPARGAGLAFAILMLIGVVVTMPLRAGASSSEGFALEEIAPGVFVHYGAIAGIEDRSRADSANIGFIIGARCVAVIDTGGSIATGAALRAALRAVTDKPICFVINTHVHFDHVLGNAAFRADRPAFIGHARLVEAMQANREYFAENFAAELQGAGVEAIVIPNETVDDTRQLDLGERVLTLVAHPTAHTTQDLTVFDATTGTLWTGDLLFLERIPALDGSLRGWVAALSGFDRQPIERVVAGHGRGVSRWGDAAAATRRYLSAVQDQTRTALNDGVSLEAAVAAVAREERGHWALFDEVHGRNVTRAYKELEWE